MDRGCGSWKTKRATKVAKGPRHFELAAWELASWVSLVSCRHVDVLRNRQAIRIGKPSAVTYMTNSQRLTVSWGISPTADLSQRECIGNCDCFDGPVARAIDGKEPAATSMRSSPGSWSCPAGRARDSLVSRRARET